MHRYDDLFFSYIESGALRSARRIVPLLAATFPVHSVVDFGCGRGAWLRVFAENAVEDVLGIDGPYISQSELLIGAERFRAADLCAPIELGRRFDLAISFEVGEHLPETAAPRFVHTICRHAPIVAFSAAVPGQGGEHHVNEQPYTFWRDLFAGEGFRLFDWIRPHIAGDGQIEPWYRNNALLFVADAAVAGLPAAAAATEVPPGEPIADRSSLPAKLRRSILQLLSVEQVDRLAVAKHAAIVATQRLRSARPSLGSR
jgi:SAM-dependent methyltransferase